MKGVVGSGSQQSAAAACEVLQKGGNAVDAVVAACVATGIGEPSLTSLAGAGVMVFHDGKSGETTYLDFFSNAPGLGAPDGLELDFFPVELDWGPAKEIFHIGRGAAGVPSVIPGLMTAIERWGRLNPRDVVSPACRMLREGAVVTDFQAVGLKLLEPILMNSEKGRTIYGRRQPDGSVRVPVAGEHFAHPVLADALEAMTAGDWKVWYRDEFCARVLEEFGVDNGGIITERDLEAFDVIVRDPITVDYRGHQVHLNPLPSVGGNLIAFALELLRTLDLSACERARPEHLRALSAAMRMMDESRAAGGDPRAPENFPRWEKRYAEVLRDLGKSVPPAISCGPPSTTHASVIDAEGNAAAVTFSHGEGCGHLVGNTGIVMNNLMGEADIHPDGFHKWPLGTRLSTGVCPSVVLSPDGTTTVLGTGGANRIRTAIVQTLVNTLDYGLPLREAVAAPRIHWEGGVLNAELADLPGGPSDIYDTHVEGETLVRFENRAMFFGGVHAAQRKPDGAMCGAGDPRRGGTVMEA